MKSSSPPKTIVHAACGAFPWRHQLKMEQSNPSMQEKIPNVTKFILQHKHFSHLPCKRGIFVTVVSVQNQAHQLHSTLATGLQELNVSLQFASFSTDYSCKTQLSGRWNAKTEKVAKACDSQLRTTYYLNSSVQKQFLSKQEQKYACVLFSSFTCRNQSNLEENTHPPTPSPWEVKLIPGSQHKLHPPLTESHAMEQVLRFSTRPERSVQRQTCLKQAMHTYWHTATLLSFKVVTSSLPSSSPPPQSINICLDLSSSWPNRIPKSQSVSDPSNSSICQWTNS